MLIYKVQFLLLQVICANLRINCITIYGQITHFLLQPK